MDIESKIAAFEARAQQPARSRTAAGASVVLRADAYVNAMSGFGGSRDPLQRTTFAAEYVPGQAELEQMYRFFWLVRRIVDLLPGDACREGIEITTEDEDLGADLYRRMDELLVWERLEEALRMARLYGGSIVLLGAVDGQAPETPLSIERVQKVACLTVLDRWQLTIHKTFDDPLSPDFGQPELYRINAVTAAATGTRDSIVHASRVIRFGGAWLPARLRQQNQGWDDSIIVAINQNLKQFGVSIQSAAVLFQDFITKVLKIPNLAQLIADGEEATLMARIQYAVGQMSSVGVSLIGQDEEFAKVQTPITGLVELLDKFMDLTAAAVGIPKTRLFGQQLGTLAGAGETTRDYYDGVKAYQEKQLRNPLHRIITLLRAEAKAKLEKWSFEFCPLWQPTDKELAETRKTVAETDQVYIINGVLDPAEVALARFGPDGYSMETVIDPDTRTPAGDGGDVGEEKPEEADDDAQ
jgi:hypothetical protein